MSVSESVYKRSFPDNLCSGTFHDNTSFSSIYFLSLKFANPSKRITAWKQMVKFYIILKMRPDLKDSGVFLSIYTKHLINI